MMYRTKKAASASILVAALMAAVLLALFGVLAPAEAAAPRFTQQADTSSPSGNGADIYGIVEATPASGLIGQWQIGGKVYTTTAQSEFDQEEGPLALGACVKVQLVLGSNTLVRELDSEPADDCNGNGGDDDDDNGSEVYGKVEQLPAGSLIGTWVVSGKSYTVTAQTEIKQKYGPIRVDGCVKLHLLADGTTVREAETDRHSRCNGGHDDDDDDNGGNGGGIGKGELYATVTTTPTDGLLGIWVIGNISFTVDANTELSTKNGGFAPGVLVKVEFVILQDGTFRATEIKTAYTPDSDDDDDDNGHGHGHGHGEHEGKAFGLIEVLPTGGLTGTWQISGISYTVNISTEFHNDAANFVVGARVKVEYETDDDGNRTAEEIKIAGRGGSVGNEDRKLVGYVEAVPADGLIGAWMIAGVPFSTTAETKFDESNGLLVLGAFVKVEYKIVNNVRIAMEIEAKVPPGCGDGTHVGKVEKMDDSSAAAAAVDAATTWVVGGRTFVVDEATKIDDSLSTSSTAVVNSYTAADGSEVATRISSVTIANFLFMPAARK